MGMHMDTSLYCQGRIHLWVSECTWTPLLSRYKSPMVHIGHFFYFKVGRMTLLCKDFGSPWPLLLGMTLILGLFSLVLHSKVSLAIGCMHAWLPFCHMVEFNNSLMSWETCHTWATNPYYFISNLELLETLNPNFLGFVVLSHLGPLLNPKFWDLWSLLTWDH
jgi:hypothetical protein